MCCAGIETQFDQEMKSGMQRWECGSVDGQGDVRVCHQEGFINRERGGPSSGRAGLQWLHRECIRSDEGAPWTWRLISSARRTCAMCGVDFAPARSVAAEAARRAWRAPLPSATATRAALQGAPPLGERDPATPPSPTTSWATKEPAAARHARHHRRRRRRRHRRRADDAAGPTTAARARRSRRRT